MTDSAGARAYLGSRAGNLRLTLTGLVSRRGRPTPLHPVGHCCMHPGRPRRSQAARGFSFGLVGVVLRRRVSHRPRDRGLGLDRLASANAPRPVISGRHGSACTRHRMRHLLAAVLAAVGYVIDLPSWQQSAHLHAFAAAGALWRMDEQAGRGLVLRCHHKQTPAFQRLGSTAFASSRARPMVQAAFTLG